LRKTKSITKFAIIGIIVGIIAIGVSFVAINPDISTTNDSQSNHLSIDTRNGSPLLGSPSAPITIIEFGDYQCPFCRSWNVNTKPTIEKNFIDTGKVNLIYVDFAIVGPDSIKAHAGSYCAAEQNLYWQYHDFMYANQGHENSGWANPSNIKQLVSDIPGLNNEQFSQCLDSGKYEKRVNDNRNVARNAGATSTPSFIIIGQEGKAVTLTGAQPYASFQKAIESFENN
jgi:protein-disulfide isomerase